MSAKSTCLVRLWIVYIYGGTVVDFFSASMKYILFNMEYNAKFSPHHRTALVFSTFPTNEDFQAERKLRKGRDNEAKRSKVLRA